MITTENLDLTNTAAKAMPTGLPAFGGARGDQGRQAGETALIRFEGQSASEKNILAFKDSLEKDAAFSEISLPLSDIQPNSDLGFSFRLSFKAIF